MKVMNAVFKAVTTFDPEITLVSVSLILRVGEDSSIVEEEGITFNKLIRLVMDNSTHSVEFGRYSMLEGETFLDMVNDCLKNGPSEEDAARVLYCKNSTALTISLTPVEINPPKSK